jgi:hypothetical protein
VVLTGSVVETKLIGVRAPLGCLKLRTSFVVAGVLAGAFVTGCSADAVDTPSASAVRTYVETSLVEALATEPHVTTTAVTTVAVTTVAVTTVAPTSSAPTSTTVESESARIAEVADASAAEYLRQITSQEFDEVKLTDFGSRPYIDEVRKAIDQDVADNRRYERGTINEFRNVSVGWASGDVSAAVFTCYRNNDAEFDTKGTPDKGDDVLIQADMLITAYQRSFTLEEGKWKEGKSKSGDVSFCSGLFG